MLQLRNDIFENITAIPKEHYTFNFAVDEFELLEKKYVNKAKIRGAIPYVPMLILLVQGILFIEDMVWIALGMIYVWAVLHISSIVRIKKLYAKHKQTWLNTLYDYTLYDGFLIVWISSDDSIRQRKFYLQEIKKARIIKNLVVLEIENELYLLKKDQLTEDSYFLNLCTKKTK